MYLGALNKGIPKFKARKLKINFEKTKDNIFSYSCVKEERMIEVPQQNEVDFSCHSSLLGSVMLRKALPFFVLEGRYRVLFSLLCFHLVLKVHIAPSCTYVLEPRTAIRCRPLFRESAVKIGKCNIKYNFYKKHLFPE